MTRSYKRKEGLKNREIERCIEDESELKSLLWTRLGTNEGILFGFIPAFPRIVCTKETRCKKKTRIRDFWMLDKSANHETSSKSCCKETGTNQWPNLGIVSKNGRKKEEKVG